MGLGRIDGNALTLSFFVASAVGMMFAIGNIPSWYFSLEKRAFDTLDAMQHVIGQFYFLNDTENWSSLAIHRLDSGRANVFFTDSLPLQAIILKTLKLAFGLSWIQSGVLAYVILAFVLQPVAFVYALAAICRVGFFMAFWSSIFSLSAPVFLVRFGHTALLSHFLINFLIGLGFRIHRAPTASRLAWATIVCLVAFVTHPYLFAMCAALFLGNGITFAIRRDWSCARRTCLAFLVAIAAAFAIYRGFGLHVATGQGGFGFYSMNLLAPFWPGQSSLWPFPVPTLDATGGQAFEGAAWLGFGFFGLAILAALTARAELVSLLRQHIGLVLVTLGMVAYAVSPVITLGPFVLDTGIRLPVLGQVFRASGRFVWPATYLAALLLLGSLGRSSRPNTVAAVGICAFVQFADTANARAWLRHLSQQPAVAKLLDGPTIDLVRSSESILIYPTFPCRVEIKHAQLIVEAAWVASERVVPLNTFYRAFRRDDRCDLAEEKTRIVAGPAPGQLMLIDPSLSERPAAVPCRETEHVIACSHRLEPQR